MSLRLPSPRPTRRQLVVGGVTVAVLGISGCTDASSPRVAPALPRLRRDPDLDLVVASLAVEHDHLERLRAVGRRHRRVAWLRRGLAGAVPVHAAHVELLQAAVEDAAAPETAPWPAPGSPGRALASLVASARTVSQEQADIAMAAESGTFARLAAGMAAAAAQQELVLAGLAPRGRRAEG